MRSFVAGVMGWVGWRVEWMLVAAGLSSVEIVDDRRLTRQGSTVLRYLAQARICCEVTSSYLPCSYSGLRGIEKGK